MPEIQKPLVLGDQIDTRRTRADGRVEKKIFTVEKISRGVFYCVSHRLKLGAKIYIRSHYRANFQILKNGVLTDTAHRRRDGTTRWEVVRIIGNVNDPSPASVPLDSTTPERVSA